MKWSSSNPPPSSSSGPGGAERPLSSAKSSGGDGSVAAEGKVALYSLIIYKYQQSAPNPSFVTSTSSSSSSSSAVTVGGAPSGGARVLQLSCSVELQSFPFFHRGTVKEHIQFHSRLVASRTPVGCRQRVEFEQNLGFCHAYVHPCGLAATVLTSTNYPIRVAFGLITTALKKFQELYCGRWENIAVDVADSTFFSKEGAELLQAYQNPVEADKLLKVQKDLEEVKDVMLKNMDDLLQRGEKLEDLMQKSEDLSTTSYQFFRQAKKNNQCCQFY